MLGEVGELPACSEQRRYFTLGDVVLARMVDHLQA
jgi:hypothetical protein